MEDVDSIPVLYIALGALQRYLSEHMELAWAALGLVVVLWYYGVFGKAYGALIDLFYYKKDTAGPAELEMRRRAMMLAREQMQKQAKVLSDKDAEERKEKERQETIEKGQFKSNVKEAPGFNGSWR